MTLQMANVWVTVSVYMERYIAICHPFRAARIITRRKTLIVIAAISCVSIIYNIPHLFSQHAVPCDSLAQPATYTDAPTSSGSPQDVTASSARDNVTVSYLGRGVTDSVELTVSEFMQETNRQLMNILEGTASSGGHAHNKTNVVHAVVDTVTSHHHGNNNTTPVYATRSSCLTLMDSEFGRGNFFQVYRTTMYTVFIFILPFCMLLILNG